jgi:hypothetical protein
VIAIGLISPVNWIVIGLAAIWIPVVGVVLYRQNKDVELTRVLAEA